LGELVTISFCIAKDIKPASSIAVLKDDLSEFSDICTKFMSRYIEEEVKYITLGSPSERHYLVYFFKYPHILHILGYLHNREDLYDQEVLDHWVNGKLFGIPDSEISKFVGEQSCTGCGFNVVVTQPPEDSVADYWWYCSNKECHYHVNGEATGDMEKPSWVKYQDKT